MSEKFPLSLEEQEEKANVRTVGELIRFYNKKGKSRMKEMQQMGATHTGRETCDST